MLICSEVTLEILQCSHGTVFKFNTPQTRTEKCNLNTNLSFEFLGSTPLKNAMVLPENIKSATSKFKYVRFCDD